MRCLASIGIYLRLIGLDEIQSQSNRLFTNLGLSLLAIYLALQGLMYCPVNLIQIDRDTQSLIVQSIWPNHIRFVISMTLSILMIGSSVIYSIPLLIDLIHRFSNAMIKLADRLTIISLLITIILSDLNVSYWKQNGGSQLWFELRLILESLTVFMGILVLSHMNHHDQTSSNNKSE